MNWTNIRQRFYSLLPISIKTKYRIFNGGLFCLPIVFLIMGWVVFAGVWGIMTLQPQCTAESPNEDITVRQDGVLFLLKKYDSISTLLMTEREKNLYLSYSLSEYESFGVPVQITVYHPTKEQTDDTPLITASGDSITFPIDYRWAAVSIDLERKGFKLGRRMVVNCDCPYAGVWIIRDRMHNRWRRKIDLLTESDAPLFNGYGFADVLYN